MKSQKKAILKAGRLEIDKADFCLIESMKDEEAKACESSLVMQNGGKSRVHIE